MEDRPLKNISVTPPLFSFLFDGWYCCTKHLFVGVDTRYIMSSSIRINFDEPIPEMIKRLELEHKILNQNWQKL